jgi:hypothetical protein
MAFDAQRALKARIAELEKERDEALDGYRRWHQAFLDAKYPEVLPTRVDLEKRIRELEAQVALLEGLRETARQAPHCESCTCFAGEREGEYG